MEEADLFGGLFVSVIAWWRARQLQDRQTEARQKERRLKLRRARRLRMKKLHQTWKMRDKVCKQNQLHRFRAHDKWMKAATHRFLSGRLQRRAKVWFYPRSSNWWETTAAAFTDDEWLRHFSVSRKTFDYICTALEPQLKRQDTLFRLCIPLQKRVALPIYKLAQHHCDYKTLGNLFAVGAASVCHCLHDFCTAVIQVLKPQLVEAPNDCELVRMADFFYHTYGIPQCIGVVHGMRIPIIRPPHYYSEQPSRDSYLAIVLQAVSDGKGMFWDLNMTSPTWVTDSSALTESWACEDFPIRMQNLCGSDGGLFILGDAGCPSDNWLLKPYTNTSWLTPEQELFNTQIGQAHSVAQYAFERLKGRWRFLNKRNDCTVEIVKDMVETCCVLHNLCEKNEDTFLPEWIVHDEPIVNGTANE